MKTTPCSECALNAMDIDEPLEYARMYTKKIGKNNPKAAEIEADNAARQEWNRTADMAPKPTLDIAEFCHMRNLIIKVQDKAVKIKNLQDKVLS